MAAIVKTMHFNHSAVTEECSALRTNTSKQNEGKTVPVSLCNFLPLSISGRVTLQDGGPGPQEQQKLFSLWTVGMEIV